MNLAARLNQIIKEQKLTKKEFAAKLSITENYIYLLTGNSKNRPETMAHSLARLIALEFGYDEEWILHGVHGADSVKTADEPGGPIKTH